MGKEWRKGGEKTMRCEKGGKERREGRGRVTKEEANDLNRSMKKCSCSCSLLGALLLSVSFLSVQDRRRPLSSYRRRGGRVGREIVLLGEQGVDEIEWTPEGEEEKKRRTMKQNSFFPFLLFFFQTLASLQQGPVHSIPVFVIGITLSLYLRPR